MVQGIAGSNLWDCTWTRKKKMDQKQGSKLINGKKVNIE